MNATVGAAMKQLAVFLIGDENGLKKIGTALLVLLVAVFTPIIAVVMVFNSDIPIDTAQLTDAVVANMSEEQVAQFQQIENTMLTIESAMDDADMPSRAKAAQMLYVLALEDQSQQPDFIPKLVGCFSPEQTEAELVASVNAAFGTHILVEDFVKVIGTIHATEVDTSGYINPAGKNNLDLVKWAKDAKASGWGYVFGTFGNVLTESGLAAKKQQYPDNIGQYEDFIRKNWMGRRTADCVGLIKGYGWYNPDTGNIAYGSNGMPDVSADQMYQQASRKGPISTIPEVPGLAVWHTGHIGIYIGNGQVIEAMGTRYGVVQTNLSSRSFTHWLQIPYITYMEAS